MLSIALSMGIALAPAAAVLAQTMQAYAEEPGDVENLENDAEEETDGVENLENGAEEETGSVENLENGAEAETGSDENRENAAVEESGNTENSAGSETAGSQKNHAVLIYAKDDASLKDGTKKDAEAMAATLRKTDQFRENAGTIEHFPIQQNSMESVLEELWAKIDAIAEHSGQDSLTVIYYSGHGGAQKDGTSYLALGGLNNITADSLKTHLKDIKGKVLVVIDACYAGGMIMTAGAEDDETVESYGGFDGDDFAEALYGTQSTAAEGTGTAAGQRLYFIAASNGAETSILSYDYGSMLTAALEGALGYDCRIETYNTYAADTETASGAQSRSGYSGDGQITMTELVKYYKRTAITSTPVLYPQSDDTVLFTYGEDVGKPASLVSSLCDAYGNDVQENIQYDKDRESIHFRIKVQNLSNEQITVQVGATPLWNALITACTPGEQGTQNSYVIWNGTETVPAGETKIFETEFFWNAFGDTEDLDMNPYVLRIWDCSSRNYNLLSFYTSTKEGNGEIDETKLSLQKPTEVSTEGLEGNSKLVVARTSRVLPMEIVYDDRSENKQTNAACRLSLYAYDLGTELSNGIHVDSSDSAVLADLDGQNVLDGVTPTAVFENVRPSHERKAGTEGLSRDSVHTYVMNTSELEMGHYYALQVQCVYDDSEKSARSVWTVIQKVSEKEANEETYKIPSFTYGDDYSYFWKYYNGIPLAGWEKSSTYVGRTVKNVTDELSSMLEESEINGLYAYSICDEDDPEDTGWCRWNEKTQSWEEMAETDTFEYGSRYKNRVMIYVIEGYNVEFTSGTRFEVYHHNLVGNAVIYDNDMHEASSGRIAEIWLEHVIPEQEENVLRLYRAVDGDEWTQIGSDELKTGDKVIIRTVSDAYEYNWKLLKGLEKTKETVTKDGTKWEVFEVTKSGGETKPSVEIMLWNSGSKTKENSESSLESCSCATDVYVWNVDGSESPSEDDDAGKGGGSGSDGDLDVEGGSDEEEPGSGSAGDAAQEAGVTETSASGISGQGTAEASVVSGTSEKSGTETMSVSEISGQRSSETAEADGSNVGGADTSDSGSLQTRGKAVSGTGDEGQAEMWLFISLGAAAGLAGVQRMRRKRSHYMFF